MNSSLSVLSYCMKEQTLNNRNCELLCNKNKNCAIKIYISISIFFPILYCCHGHRTWVKLYSCREEALAPPVAVSRISSPAWATTCLAATPAIHVTAASLKLSVTVAAWTTPANMIMHRARHYPELVNGCVHLQFIQPMDVKMDSADILLNTALHYPQ